MNDSDEVEKFFGVKLHRPNIDIPTYAYLMWRRDVEGLRSYSDVNVPSQYSGIAYNTEQFYLNVQSVEIFTFILDEFIRKLPDEKCTIDYKCAIERIIATLLYQHYKNWLYISEKIDSSKINMKEAIPYIMPFIILKNIFGNDNYMEVYFIELKQK